MKKLIFAIGIGATLTGCSLFGNKVAEESLKHLEDKFYNSMVENFKKGEIGNSYQQDMNLTLNVNKNPMFGIPETLMQTYKSQQKLMTKIQQTQKLNNHSLYQVL